MNACAGALAWPLWAVAVLLTTVGLVLRAHNNLYVMGHNFNPYFFFVPGFLTSAALPG